ncbi:MAG TPA: LuxR C-terminal-related transcriptional regulator [Ktedonobacteraceae bacterium]|nr:LuxR C-terminal-related transcriptional regulator [Ktedonobacteraceae bacterium]
MMEGYEQHYGKFPLLQLLDKDIVEDPSIKVAVSQADEKVCFQSVPIPLTPLIGRESEIQAARNLLQRPDVRLVTLIGAGGVGKTHLAMTLGDVLLDTFDNGVVFISLDTIYDSELVVPAIAQALGLEESRKESTIQSLKMFLRDMHILLVLDNFEQILPAAPHLSELLLSCPQLKILVTSRSVLHVWGEHICRVQPLEIPDPQQLPELESLAHVASIKLFVQRAEAILPEFKLTTENARDIAEICKRLDGLPLALEQAAMHCNLLSPNAIVSRLKHPIEILTGGRRDAPARHHTLHNMLSWNEDLLTPDEHKLYRRLAVFEQGFTLRTAEDFMSVFGDLSISTFDGITSLIDKSMLQQTLFNGEEPRLYFFEVLRAYGLELLDVSGETEQTRNAHASYFVALAEACALDTDQSIEQIPWQSEAANLRATLAWLLECGQRSKALRVATVLEKISEKPEDIEFLRSRLKTGKLDLANHQVFKPSDLLEIYSKEEHPNLRYHDTQGVVIDLRHIDNTVPHQGNYVREAAELLSTSPYQELTAREVEVLRLLAQGLSNKKIAERLVLSPHTVSGHIQSIFGKLALNTRSAATRFALEHHLA